MKLRSFGLVTVVAGLVTHAPLGWADETADEINALKRQIQELDQKVRMLERQRELDPEAAEARPKDGPRLTVGSSGLSVSSADTNFVFQVHGLLQTDNRTYLQDGGNQANDSFLLRRARPILSGTVYRDFDFLFVPDFAGNTVQIFDAYLNYRNQPWLQLRAGKFKSPVGLEQLQSDFATAFSERSLVSGLVPNRDIGFQVWGDVSQGVLSYAAGVFNGAGDSRNAGNADFEDHREFAGRIFLQPFRQTKVGFLQGFGFGLGGSFGNVVSNSAGLPATTGGSQPGYFTESQQQFFAYTNGTVANGDHWRLSPQTSYLFGPFSLLGEYGISGQRVSRGAAPFTSESLEHTAWQVTAGWMLTGEKATFAGVAPKRPFDLSAGHWGAVQLVGRYSQFDVDNAAFPLYANPAVSATGAQAWSVGLNWFLNRNIRVNASFTRTTFDGGGGAGGTAPATVTRQPEEVLITRLQMVF